MYIYAIRIRCPLLAIFCILIDFFLKIRFPFCIEMYNLYNITYLVFFFFDSLRSVFAQNIPKNYRIYYIFNASDRQIYLRIPMVMRLDR